MLGRFLEVAIATDSPAQALEFFRALGFEELATSDVLSEPYAAVWDGRVAIGLHSTPLDGPALSFVRPELKSYLHAFRRAGIGLEFSRLADEEFHQAGIVDPSGQVILLNEARTYSPSFREPAAVAACGEFLEFSLATRSLPGSADFWERLGLTAVARGTRPHAWIRLAGGGLAIGLHERAPFAAGLTFRAGYFRARCEYLRALGQKLLEGAPVAVDARRGATLATPYRLPLYLVDEPEE